MAIWSLALSDRSDRLAFFVGVLVALAVWSTEIVRSAGAPQIVGGTVGWIGAVSQPIPPRDRPAVAGTGVIRGRVIDARTGQPLARARVRLMGRSQPGSLQTDTDGTFTVSKLPPGNYTLQAERTGYSRETFPERRTLRAKPLTLGDGETLENVTILLHPSSVIAGRVLDLFDDPVERAMVQLIRTSHSRTGGEFGTQGMGMQSVNDTGEFRIPRVEPGTYILKVSLQDFGPMQQDLPPYGTTYYPGVATPEQAQQITIAKGQSLSGLEWSMLETPRTTVSGRAVDSKGEPITQAGLMIKTASSNGIVGFVGGGAHVRDGGTFEAKLEPGEYVLEIRVDNRMRRTTAGRQSTDEPERGMLRVSVGAEPITGLLITTSHGGTASGRFVFEGRGTAPPDLSRTRLNFGNFGSEQERQFMCEGGPSAPINTDGTFVVDRLWGTCYMQIPGSLGEWQLKAVTYRGEDVTNRPFAFESGQKISDIQVVFTDRRTELHLEVADDHGARVPEFVALAFPTDKELWGNRRHLHMYFPPPTPPMLSSTPPVTTGATLGSGSQGSSTPGFSSTLGPLPPTDARRRGPVIRAIPPGDYLAVVLDDVSNDDLNEPAFFERLAALATHVTIREGELKVLQLRRVEVR